MAITVSYAGTFVPPNPTFNAATQDGIDLAGASLLVVGISWLFGANSILGVTFGGVAMTQVTTGVHPATGAGYAAYVLANPPAGAQALAVLDDANHFPGTIQCSAIGLLGAGPDLGAVATSAAAPVFTGAVPTYTVTLSGVAGASSYLLLFESSINQLPGTVTPVAPLTLLAPGVGDTGEQMSLLGSLAAAAGSNSLQFTGDESTVGNTSLIAVEVKLPPLGIALDPAAGTFAAVSKSVTIGVAPVSVPLDPAAATFGAGGITIGRPFAASVRLSLDEPAPAAASVHWATQDGTAIGGTDYTVGSGTIVFAIGDTSAVITIVLATEASNGKVFDVVLSSPVGANFAGGVVSLVVPCTIDVPSSTGGDTPPSGAITTWLSTSGGKIVDASTGAPVVLKSFHWYGAEINLLPSSLMDQPGSLSSPGRPYKTITYTGPTTTSGGNSNLVNGQVYEGVLDEMKRLGFNAIRISVCQDITWPNAKVRTSVNGTPVGTNVNGLLNPDLLDGSIAAGTYNQNFIPAIQILDKFVAHCGAIGLRVVIDLHSLAPQDPSGNTSTATGGLWYTTANPGDTGTGVTNASCNIGINGDKRSEAQTKAALVFLANRYKDQPAVCGLDVINEPFAATWDNDAKTGLAAFYERMEAAIRDPAQGNNPNVLVICEGTFGAIASAGGEFTGYSGNLTGVATRPIVPVTPNKLVYSPHEYVDLTQPRFNANYPGGFVAWWDTIWGDIAKTGQAPIYIGEFAGDFRDPSTLTGQAQIEATKTAVWMAVLSAYCIANGLSWNYFSVNLDIFSNPGAGDTITGLNILNPVDEVTPDPRVMNQLAAMLAA